MKIRAEFIQLYSAISILAFTGLFAKSIPLDGLSITQLRSFVAGLCFLVFFALRKKPLMLGSWKIVCGVCFLGCLMGGHWATFFHSMQVSTVAVGMLSFFSYPIITVLVEPFFCGKKHRLADVLAAIAVLFGMLILVYPDLFSDSHSGQHLLGVMWGSFSAVLLTFRNLIQKYYFADVPSSALMFYQVVVIAIVALPFVDFSAVIGFGTQAWILVLILGAGITAGGHTLLVMSLKNLPAKSVAMIGCIQPVIAIALAWLVLSEVPELNVLVGGALIISVAVYESWQQSKG
ncbi:MAG: drug/metabolite transporter (DMT)-like permease [Flavobacteriales bacterium]